MRDPKQRDGLPPGDAKFLKIIDEFGWHVMSVVPRLGEEGEVFSYSTGLYLRFKHPEILLCGLDSGNSTGLINTIGEEIKRGVSFNSEIEYPNIFAGEVKCRFRPVKSANFNDYVCWSQWFYEYQDFPVLQCFWPDKHGYYPWEKECHPDVKRCQPLLYNQPRSVM